MKATAARRFADMDDLAFLIDRLNLDSVEDVEAVCANVFPEEPLGDRQREVIADVLAGRHAPGTIGRHLRLDAVDIVRRARAAYGPDGRPALPPQVTWPIFPFETDGLRVRPVEDPVVPEPPRRGEDLEDCRTCQAGDGAFVWSDDRWRVSMPPEPASLPTLTLHTRDHLDFHELDDRLGAELGVLLVRAQRALASIPGVGRVHVYKWGDGGAHLHVVLIARPQGMRQLWGMFLSAWLPILPPLPAPEWGAIRDHVATRLATPGPLPAG